MRRLVLALCAFVLLPLVATPPAAADETAPFASVTTAQTTNPRPLHGQTFQIVGQVWFVGSEFFSLEPFPLPARTVTIERRLSGSSSWSPVGSAVTKETTLSNGKTYIMYTANVRAVRRAWYRARYDGIPGSLGASRSDDGTAEPAAVRVHRNMPIRLTRPTPRRLALAGSVRPGYARKQVVVQRRTCEKCAWKTFATRRTTNKGAYRVRLSNPRRGFHDFRAVAKGSAGLETSSSQIARIKAG